MTSGLVKHIIVSSREIGGCGSTVRVLAAGDEPVILKIVHQRRNMLALGYVRISMTDDMDRSQVDRSPHGTCEA